MGGIRRGEWTMCVVLRGWRGEGRLHGRHVELAASKCGYGLSEMHIGGPTVKEVRC